MKKKQQNLPAKTKQNEVITVNQEKTKTLDITNKLHHLKIDLRSENFFRIYLEGF